MPNDRLEHSVFISFAEEDLSFVEDLVRQLRDRDFEPWYYLTSMRAGDRIHQRLMQAIIAATVVIVVVSRHSGQSSYVEREISFAQEQGKPIIPLVLNEPNDDASLKFLLEGIHRIDAQRGHDYMRDLQHALNIPPPPVPLSPWRRLILFWGKVRAVVLVALSMVLIGWVVWANWNSPLRDVPAATWIRLTLSGQPPPVPLNIMQSPDIKNRLKYYGDRDNNKPAKRFDEELSNRFRIDTGIKVEVFNPPEEQRLKSLQDAFARSSYEHDVIMIDTVWIGELSKHLINLNDYINKEEIDEHQHEIIDNNKVEGKLVALPWFEDFGLLYYRKDLLDKAGEKAPPDTWKDLERIAAKIQHTQRSNGHNTFIGFAWQGEAYEGLTCNALEWIASQGGYNTAKQYISDRQIVVEALDRARIWLNEGPDQISRGVDGDKEEESLSRFTRGDAAFLRMWSSAFARVKQAKAIPFDVAPLPSAGGHKSVGMVGGWQLAVPIYSRNPRAAVEFIRYLTSPEVQSWRALKSTFLPTIVAKKLEVQTQLSSLYALRNNSQLIRRITRPSKDLGLNYDRASDCYSKGVHRAVLAATRLQVEQEVSNMAQDPHCQKFFSQHQ